MHTSLRTTVCVVALAMASMGAQAAIPDGTYVGEGQGRNGPIKVQVTTANDRITEVKVLSHAESAGISDIAFERVPQAMVESQTAAVDAVGGATLSSQGLISAVVAALKTSGADISKLTKPATHQSLAQNAAKDVNADILVIGSGNGGITAAVKAAMAGKKVVLIEKRAAVGGVSALNHGGLAATGTRYQREVMKETNDSAELLFKDMLKGGTFHLPCQAIELSL